MYNFMCTQIVPENVQYNAVLHKLSSSLLSRTNTHSAELEPAPGLEALWLTFLQEPTPEMMCNTCIRGFASMLADLLKKCPERVRAVTACKTLPWKPVAGDV